VKLFLRQPLVLARTHLLQQLQSSQNPRHREIIEKALADLEKQLASTEEVDRSAAVP
jgi:hypothetical protein